jgi:hypothetical protein
VPQKLPTFHIFSGCYPDNDVVWIESVEGYAAAKQRMERIAAEKPGPYFVFSVPDGAPLATTDTTHLKAKNVSADAEQKSGAA